ncbi:MAG: hypothetical protein ACI8S6_002232 [Myxococcota bacterium]|jgi:hypothetical protein
MTSNPPDELLALIELWAAHFGYYDGKINLQSGGDLSTLTTSDCTLTAHAPLWGTKKGQEQAVPATAVRKQLSGMLKWMRIGRHDMHMARHPEGSAICLFFVVRARFFLLPFNLMTVPLAFVVTTSVTDDGLRIKEIHEWPAATPEQAHEVLVDRCGWPAETTFEPHVAFGALS